MEYYRMRIINWSTTTSLGPLISLDLLHFVVDANNFTLFSDDFLRKPMGMCYQKMPFVRDLEWSFLNDCLKDYKLPALTGTKTPHPYIYTPQRYQSNCLWLGLCSLFRKRYYCSGAREMHLGVFSLALEIVSSSTLLVA